MSLFDTGTLQAIAFVLTGFATSLLVKAAFQALARRDDEAAFGFELDQLYPQPDESSIRPFEGAL